jgi:hypothetical protein
MNAISVYQPLRHRPRRHENFEILSLYRQSLQLRIDLEFNQNRPVDLPRLLKRLIQVRRSVRTESRTAVRFRNGDSVETRKV